MRCPHCGSDDYGPIDAGVDVCPDCGYDSENRTPAPTCVGCGVQIGVVICCDACWARVPTRLPGATRPWRNELRMYRRIKSWRGVEDTTKAVRAWLADHPRRAA